MAAPFIRISGLKKYYEMGGQVVRALDGVDLDMDAHTFTVVMGPSGSGKSTLLYLLGGLDHGDGRQGKSCEMRTQEHFRAPLQVSAVLIAIEKCI